MPVYQPKNIGKDLRHLKIILLLPEFGSLTFTLKTGFKKVLQGTHCVLNFPYGNYKKLYTKIHGIEGQSHDRFRLGQGYENTSVNVLDMITSFYQYTLCDYK